ncbi:MAG: NAD(P)-dependent oxidoreductase [Fimbriimonadaceae bacterium]|nr:MAG: NAD(P)-dependent oxidoreductase [Fimbriimonadaceae bacterium]
MAASDHLQIGFIGLGTMGSPMAGHLASKGFNTLVWNRTPGKEAHAVSCGATLADSPEQVAQTCDIIALCLGRTGDVTEIVGRLLENCKPGATIVDHSTISPAGARNLFNYCKSHQVEFVDAPITGGSMGAQAGTLTIFCGGTESAFETVKPVLEAYGKRIAHVGESGQGQMMKMANQIAVGGALLGLCESLAFAERAGLDLQTARDLLSTGAAGSWAFDNYGPKVIAKDWSPGFSVKNQRKDFGYCQESAAEMNMPIPGTALVDALLAELTASGREEETTAALFEVLVKKESNT